MVDFGEGSWESSGEGCECSAGEGFGERSCGEAGCEHCVCVWGYWLVVLVLVLMLVRVCHW